MLLGSAGHAEAAPNWGDTNMHHADDPSHVLQPTTCAVGPSLYLVTKKRHLPHITRLPRQRCGLRAGIRLGGYVNESWLGSASVICAFLVDVSSKEVISSVILRTKSSVGHVGFGNYHSPTGPQDWKLQP